MKLQLALATALLAVSISAVQAADTRTPDILGSVSTGSVQALSKADVSNTRGERVFYYLHGSWHQGSMLSRDGNLGWKNHPTGGRVYAYSSRYVGNGWFHVSR